MAAARISVRSIPARSVRFYARQRHFSSKSMRRDAHNFTMPAMSPTMTEGNIASWKVKEGDPFSVGDVLLEIETDKASMDVEAADDGVMFKIIAQDGSKTVQVGSRIAVLAEQGDNLSSLEMPADDTKPVSKPSDNVSKAEDAQQTSEPRITGTPEKPRSSRDRPATSPSGPGQNTKYPLYPSVISLIHENHIPDDEVAKISATGPQNRLLKGDVLAYLGRLADGEYASKQSKRLEHLSHLDLSNIKLLSAEKPREPQATAATTDLPEVPKQASVSLPISLADVLKAQKRIHDTLGTSLPLSTFLARAVDIANDDLPKPKGSLASSNDLFNAILGLDAIPSTSRGTYLPQIDALPPPSAATTTKTSLRPSQQPDIIDVLTGRARPARRSTRPVPPTGPSLTPGGALNIFTVTVPAGEENRARTFLERMKTVLQVEPGRLVL